MIVGVAAVLIALLALSALHPYALLFAASGVLVGAEAAGPGRLWIAAVLVPLAMSWLSLAAVINRRFWVTPIALFGFTALVWIAHRQSRGLAVALIAVVVQLALALHIALVGSKHPNVDRSSTKFVLSLITAIQRQAAWPVVVRFRYRGCGQIPERDGYLEVARMCEELRLDPAAAAPLAEYISKFSREARGETIGECFHPSSTDENDRMLRPVQSSGDGLTWKLHRRAVITFAAFGHNWLVPLFLYRFSAVLPPVWLSLPEARIVAVWLTPAPHSTLQLTVPRNRVVSTEPAFVKSTPRGARERLEFDVGYPRPLSIGMLDHLFMMSAGVQLTFARRAFASPRWIAFLRFLSSATGRWVLLVACGLLTSFLLRSRA